MQTSLQIEGLIKEFMDLRNKTLELFSPLDIEDAVTQSSDFGSPPNWHIAHVTWFFHKILEKYSKSYNSYDDDYNLSYLNSYYQKYGSILKKSDRGRYPRPTVIQTIKYRKEIEKLFVDFIELTTNDPKDYSNEMTLDIYTAFNHERQHQELMIYDFQYYYNRFLDDSDNYVPKKSNSPFVTEHVPKEMICIDGGLFLLGYNGEEFCYDNELPENKVYLNNYKIDNRLVTNREFIEFIEAGGYQNYRYWLADGWEMALSENWNSPLYWVWDKDNNKWNKKDFRGTQEIRMDEPVVNLSYYEVDAFCKWAKKRLPTEAEWEKAASWDSNSNSKTIYPWGNTPMTTDHANLLDSYIWHTTEAGCYPKGKSHYGCYQMMGDVWEWTSSEYVLYPGFQSRFEEYTDKWAINQKVLRGGSFATPNEQIRNSYRNYFKPHERILFSGFRCAADT
ncbi:ergothioneine biosynthesis protein EgtB [Candidatus Nitrosocosmicus arcticus]|uniref:Formylglycine-generating sulfatase enzyme n=1 Tax=Candidatus Nitrosocosmicus arcticus TaxID=2035267 RepID=A0A557SSQ7_9ARCH|nr:ergothioneine biosynthesis protein EgtB [Candidatus Nitrosocosmicus arcticus]TVP39634.1 Formylglycine-generating sulfatase enzyme [Candidatus Nitrosocosmicus arcticus]